MPPVNVRRVGERHKIVRQTDFGFGVDARTDSEGPSRPDPHLPVRSLRHDLCHGWDLPWWLPAVTHPSVLPWEILWTEEPGGLQSMG